MFLLERALNKMFVLLVLFFWGNAVVFLQAMPPKIFEKRNGVEKVGGMESSPEQERRDANVNEDDLSSELDKQYSLKKDNGLTLEDFEAALEKDPMAERFLIIKNKKEKTVSIQSAGAEENNPGRVISENQEIFKKIKAVLREQYPREEVEKFFSEKQDWDERSGLSAEGLREIFSHFKSIAPNNSNEETISLEKHQKLIDDFCDSVQQANHITEEASKIHHQLNDDAESWYLDSIDVIQINLANYRAVEAKLAEIAKVASVRLHQCKNDKINLKGVLDADLSFLSQFVSGYNPLEAMIKEANRAHEEWNALFETGQDHHDEASPTSRIRNTNPRSRAKIRAQNYWERIFKEVKNIQELLHKNGPLQKFQEELQCFKKTYGYFQERRASLQAASLEQQRLAAQHWENVFSTTKKLLSVFLKENRAPVSNTKENLENPIQKISREVLEAKNSFKKEEEIAAHCLENKSIYFFQEEQQRSKALKEMRHAWEKKIERCTGEYQKLLKEKILLQQLLAAGEKLREEWQQIPHIAQNFILPFIKNEEIILNAREELFQIESKLKKESEAISKKSEELSALQRSIEAIKAIEEAEATLTKFTKIEWEPADLVPKNNWANDTLSDVFVTTRGQAHKARKQALKCEEELFDQMEEVQKNYRHFEQLFSSSSMPSIKEIQILEKNLEETLTKASKEAAKSRKAWNKAQEAIRTAKENKLNWAKNLLRLAGSATGDFSLGEATKRDADLLGKLWIGANGRSWSKSSEQTPFPDAISEGVEFEEESIDGFISDDGLKRFRTLSYKPNFKKYQVNFERRSAPDKSWQGSEQDGSVAWGNGHLMITNPHIEDGEENAMSLKFVTLKPLHWNEEIYQEKEKVFQMNIEKLLGQGNNEKSRLIDAEIQLEIARHDQREKDINRISQEIHVIKEQLLAITKEAKDSCQEGLQMAPQEKKEWWKGRLERISLELENDGNNLAYWEKIFVSVGKGDSFQNQKIKQNQAAYDLVPEQENVLKNFWKTKIKNLEQEMKHQQVQKFYSHSKIKYINAEASFHAFQREPITSDRITLATVFQQIDEAQAALDQVIKECRDLLSLESGDQELFVAFWKNIPAFCEEEKRRLDLLKNFCEDTHREKEIGVMTQEVNKLASNNELHSLSRLLADIVAKREEQLAAYDQIRELYDQEVESLATLNQDSWRKQTLWWEKQARSIGLRRNEILLEHLHAKLEQIGVESQLLYAQANASRFYVGGISLWQQAIQKNAALLHAAKEVEDEARRQLQLNEDDSLPCSEAQEQKLRTVLEKAVTTKKDTNLNKGLLQAQEATTLAFVDVISDRHQKESFETALAAWEQSLQEFTEATTRPLDDGWKTWLQNVLSIIQENKTICSEQLKDIQKKLDASVTERLQAKVREQKNKRQKK